MPQPIELLKALHRRFELKQGLPSPFSSRCSQLVYRIGKPEIVSQVCHGGMQMNPEIHQNP
jgi:hypothetical protein